MKRRSRTVDEWAERWKLDAVEALRWLRTFERAGFVEQREGFWYATERARRVRWFELEDEL